MLIMCDVSPWIHIDARVSGWLTSPIRKNKECRYTEYAYVLRRTGWDFKLTPI